MQSKKSGQSQWLLYQVKNQSSFCHIRDDPGLLDGDGHLRAGVGEAAGTPQEPSMVISEARVPLPFQDQEQSHLQ